MGCNYYAIDNFCSQCGRGEIQYHIGKSSIGRRFALHIDFEIDGKKISCLQDWLDYLNKDTVKIINEYKEEITLSDLVSNITERTGELRCHKDNVLCW